ncbi:putative aminotransferase [Ancylostoma ceylanicum]|uniref:Aspartate aminotransferase n=1 Tax=Ancylostoma ceylanicum TaxID=53326 RepID=A0A0D6LP55_9BILA|nr:putative aminotransferase [Ancylostoma ceylanicum]
MSLFVLANFVDWLRWLLDLPLPRQMSFFDGIAVAPPIEVFFMNKMFMDETSPNKVNLTVGAYRTEEGKPWVLPVVREAEKALANDETLNHEYLPVLGHEGFSQAACALVLGENSPAIKEGRYTGVQCLSGTGSLRAGAEFLARILNLKTAYFSNPTWGNHKLVFTNAGFTTFGAYQYWDAAKRCVSIDKFLADLEAAPAKSVILLHGCAHNPTGMDPTHDQWKQICEVIKRRNLFTFFDIAYQGFASGSPDADAWAVRYFVEQGMEMLIAQSFAKNFGLYNERVGNLCLVVKDPSVLPGYKSQMSLIIRANWSNPPAHGARVVHKVLTTPEMRKQWDGAIQTMSSRIKQMRAALREHLEKLKTPGTWSHITQQIGMFSYTGLNPAQVDHLVKKHKVFLLKDGRINVCGLNPNNVEYVAKAIDDAVRNVSASNL